MKLGCLRSKAYIAIMNETAHTPKIVVAVEVMTSVKHKDFRMNDMRFV